MYNVKTYKNGLRLVYNFDNSTNAVSIVFHCLVGGRDEDDTNRGIAHLAEHMFFKGTNKRTAKDIVFEFDKLGIINNAYTNQDSTVFFADGMNKDIEKIFDIMSDCFFNSTYNKEELNIEKKVVCSELEMYLDDYKDLIRAKGAEISLQGTPYEYTLGGTVDSVSKLEQKDLINFRDKFYTTDRLIISVSGNIKQEEVENLIEKYVLCYGNEEKQPISFKQEPYEIDLKNRYIFEKRDTEQCYCYIGFKSISKTSPQLLAYSAMCLVWSNLISSRLFQKVREEKGLVYAIGQINDAYAKGGVNGVMFYSNKVNAVETLNIIKKEIIKVRNEGFTEEELNTSKNVLKTAYTLKNITPSSKAQVGASSLAYNEKPFNIDCRLKEIDALELKDLNEVFNEYVNLDDINIAIVAKEDNFNALEIMKE